MATNVRDAIRLIEADGWRLVATRGRHRQYKHDAKHQATRIGISIAGGDILGDQGFYIHTDGTAYLATNNPANSIRTVNLATGVSATVGSVPGFAPSTGVTTIYDITLIPAPASLALVGFGTVLAGRRR